MAVQTNFGGLLTSLESILRDAGKTGEELLLEGANDIIEDSRGEVPVDTGTLRSSTFVDEPSRSETEISVEFGYGRENDMTNPRTGLLASEYMLAVHERLDVAHTNGKAKFLEDPLNEAIPELQNRLGNGLSATLTIRRG